MIQCFFFMAVGILFSTLILFLFSSSPFFSSGLWNLKPSHRERQRAKQKRVDLILNSQLNAWRVVEHKLQRTMEMMELISIDWNWIETKQTVTANCRLNELNYLFTRKDLDLSLVLSLSLALSVASHAKKPMPKITFNANTKSLLNEQWNSFFSMNQNSISSFLNFIFFVWRLALLIVAVVVIVI